MGIFLSVLALLYLGSLLFVIPVSIGLLWEIAFHPGNNYLNIADGIQPEAIPTLITMFLWSVGGWFVLKALFGRLESRRHKKIVALAPAGFSPVIELYGKGGKQYLGISPTTNGMVILDPYHNVEQYASMELLQGYQYEATGVKGCSNLTILFNSYDVPSMTFTIGRDRRLNDLIAQLNYAMQGGGRQHGPEVAEASIQAFESLKKQYGIQKKGIANDLPPDSSTA